MKPESVSKSLRIGFGPYTDASSGWPKLASVDATDRTTSERMPTQVMRVLRLCDCTQTKVSLRVDAAFCHFHAPRQTKAIEVRSDEAGLALPVAA